MALKDVPDKIIGKIQKLLALAADPANEQEAAAAAAQAQVLLFKYKLSLSELKDASNRDGKYGGIKLRFKSARAIPQWKRQLAVIVSSNNFCRTFFLKSIVGSRYEAALQFIGEEEDAQACAYLFEYLTQTLEKLSEKGWDNRLQYLQTFKRSYSSRDGITWKNSFYFGACAIISERMRAARRQSVKEAGVPGLVLVKKSELALNNYLQKVFGDVKEDIPKVSKMDSDGYLKGVMEGSKLPLNAPVSEDKRLK